jgi:hypothetical protein
VGFPKNILYTIRRRRPLRSRLCGPELKGVQLAVNASNVFDKIYQVCYSRFDCRIAAPMTVIGTLRYRFFDESSAFRATRASQFPVDSLKTDTMLEFIYVEHRYCAKPLAPFARDALDHDGFGSIRSKVRETGSNPEDHSGTRALADRTPLRSCQAATSIRFPPCAAEA